MIQVWDCGCTAGVSLDGFTPMTTCERHGRNTMSDLIEYPIASRGFLYWVQPDIPVPGDRVRYHGSLTSEHGLGTLRSNPPGLDLDPDRYTIDLDAGVTLTRVRRDSFTLLGAP